MILYNVTLKVDKDIHDDWLVWMKTIHIPDVMKTGLFKGYRISRMLQVDDQDGPTYSIQYSLESLKHLSAYQKQFAPGLQKDHRDRYGDRVLAFRSVMDIVEEGRASAPQ